jgi:hypothetical protein
LSSSDQVEVARRISSRAHEGQLDKIGPPHIEHSAMVAAFAERVARLDEHTRARIALKYGRALEALDVDPSVIAALHDGRSAS